MFKAQYYPNSHFLKAKGISGASFIWTGIVTARDSMSAGYRWVLGNGASIEVANDPWLRGRPDFRVDQHANYNVGHARVSEFMAGDTKTWDVRKVEEVFNEEDARLILSTCIPQSETLDRNAWTKSADGQYSVKTGYHMWQEREVGLTGIIQSSGWGKIWKLEVPHKVKVFLWRFSRNNIPVRNRLRLKGINVPILCTMCERDVEHLLHVFFDCAFANQCWCYAGAGYDM